MPDELWMEVYDTVQETMTKTIPKKKKCKKAKWLSEEALQIDMKGREAKGKEEKAMAPHSSTLAWRIPWMEEPGGLQYMGLQRVRHD